MHCLLMLLLLLLSKGPVAWLFSAFQSAIIFLLSQRLSGGRRRVSVWGVH